MEEKLDWDQRTWAEASLLTVACLGLSWARFLFQGSLGYDYTLCQPQLPNINWLRHFWIVAWETGPSAFIFFIIYDLHRKADWLGKINMMWASECLVPNSSSHFSLSLQSPSQSPSILVSTDYIVLLFNFSLVFSIHLGQNPTLNEAPGSLKDAFGKPNKVKSSVNSKCFIVLLYTCRNSSKALLKKTIPRQGFQMQLIIFNQCHLST